MRADGSCHGSEIRLLTFDTINLDLMEENLFLYWNFKVQSYFHFVQMVSNSFFGCVHV